MSSSLDIDRESLAALSSRAEAWADLFRLPLGHRTWRGMSGDFQGGGIGSSLDFQDHRAYSPGDDPRHINWQAYARTGNYTMKLYREEVRPLIDVVFDVSDSMFFDEPKQQRSLQLFYFVVHAVLKSGASGKFHLIKGEQHRYLPDEAIHTHAWIDQAKEFKDTPSSEAPRLEAVPVRAQAMRIFLSDLLFLGGTEQVLQAMVSRKGFGTVFAPFTSGEARPEWSGNYEFIDAEDRTRHQHRVQVNLLERYRKAYDRHFMHWKDMGRKYDVGIVRVPAEGDFTQAIRWEGVTAGALELWS